ncbi:MAG: hypothetical protein CM15mP59_3820 [Flavobacteriaceae bacterium]|nr:MAG: hypothetical protein CM15mP59_3820 [Flavobacteriaceae bacterium]
MGFAQLIICLFWAVLLSAQRPPNELFPLTPLGDEQKTIIDSLSISAIENLSTSDLFTLSKGYLQDQRYEEALECYEELCDRNPNRFDFQIGRGASAGFLLSGTPSIRAMWYLVHLKSGFEEAVRIQPNSLFARRALFNIYLGLPRFLGGSDAKADRQVKEIQLLNPLEASVAKVFFAMNNKDQTAFEKQAIIAYNDAKNTLEINDSRYEMAMIASQYFDDTERAINLLNEFLSKRQCRRSIPTSFCTISTSRTHAQQRPKASFDSK